MRCLKSRLYRPAAGQPILIAEVRKMTSVVVSVERCPPYPERTAEKFLMSRLPADEADAFALHAAACPACMEAMDDFERFLELLRS